MKEGGGTFKKKPEITEQFSIISPFDDNKDIGGGVFKFKEIKHILKNRFNFMTNFCF